MLLLVRANVRTCRVVRSTRQNVSIHSSPAQQNLVEDQVNVRYSNTAPYIRVAWDSAYNAPFLYHIILVSNFETYSYLEFGVGLKCTSQILYASILGSWTAKAALALSADAQPIVKINYPMEFPYDYETGCISVKPSLCECWLDRDVCANSRLSNVLSCEIDNLENLYLPKPPPVFFISLLSSFSRLRIDRGNA